MFLKQGGLWPMLMFEMTVDCLRDPDTPTRLFCFPIEFKKKYYPFIIFGFFTLLSEFKIDVEFLCGIMYGFLFHYYLEKKIAIPIYWQQKLESSFLFKWMKNKDGYISFNTVSPLIVLSTHNGPVQEQSSSFVAFRGKGTAIGGSGNNNRNNESERQRERNENNREEQCIELVGNISGNVENVESEADIEKSLDTNSTNNSSKDLKKNLIKGEI